MTDGQEPYPWDEIPASPATSELAADAFEQLQLSRERRRLHRARQKTLSETRPCLELRRDIERMKLEAAHAQRQRAEAELERVREMRALERDRERSAAAEARAAEAEREAVEAKRQHVQDVRRLAGYVTLLEDVAQGADNKRMLAELRERFDEENGESLACPECGERMGVPEHGSGRVCPACNHRRDW